VPHKKNGRDQGAAAEAGVIREQLLKQAQSGSKLLLQL